MFTNSAIRRIVSLKKINETYVCIFNTSVKFKVTTQETIVYGRSCSKGEGVKTIDTSSLELYCSFIVFHVYWKYIRILLFFLYENVYTHYSPKQYPGSATTVWSGKYFFWANIKPNVRTQLHYKKLFPIKNERWDEIFEQYEFKNVWLLKQHLINLHNMFYSFMNQLEFLWAFLFQNFR